jgi:hypothetical protein
MNNACVEVGNWRKPSYSGGMNNDCVEVATSDAVLIRDTADRDGATLSASGPAWARFLAAVR